MYKCECVSIAHAQNHTVNISATQFQIHTKWSTLNCKVVDGGGGGDRRSTRQTLTQTHSQSPNDLYVYGLHEDRLHCNGK